MYVRKTFHIIATWPVYADNYFVLIIIVLHVVTVFKLFKIVSTVTAAYSSILHATCDILSQGAYVDLVRTPNYASV